MALIPNGYKELPEEVYKRLHIIPETFIVDEHHVHVYASKDNGIKLSTNTMANWVIKSSEMYLSLIYDRLHELIYDSKVIHADETPVKVMRIDNQKISNGQKTICRVYKICWFKSHWNHSPRSLRNDYRNHAA